MPSLTTAQLLAAHRSLTNSSLTDMSHSGGLYHVVDFKRDAETGTATISTCNDVPVAVKSRELSSLIALQYGDGGRPHTRADIQNGVVNIMKQVSTRRLFAIGGVIKLVDTEGNTGIPLHERNGDVPLPQTITNQSGLVSESPARALFKRINSELGLIRINQDLKTIDVLVIQPDAETMKSDPNLGNSISHDKMKNQRHIRVSAARETGIEEMTDVEKWSVRLAIVDAELDFTPEQEKSGMIEHVEFGAFARGFIQPGCVHDDQQRQTVTLTVPYKVALPKDWTLGNIHTIDPEGYGRLTGIVSEEAFHGLKADLTPSLRDYVRQLKGEAEAAPVAAPHQELAPARN